MVEKALSVKLSKSRVSTVCERVRERERERETEELVCGDRFMTTLKRHRTAFWRFFAK